jgi:GT2 family glycosyltransferase
MEKSPASDRPTFSIIIPHLNGKQHLEECLGSLRRQSFTDFEVILVDNGSSDGSQEYLRSHFPEVMLLELGKNMGFTGACIAGYKVSNGDFIVLLNNDTAADERWLETLVDAFERLPEAGSVASKMLLYDQRDVIHSAGDYYRVDGIPGNRGVWQKDSPQYNEETFVFGACGGAASYRRELLHETGFLDDDFFFSCEDVDLAWRIHLAGYKVLYSPRAVVYHKLKASSGPGAMSSYYDGRNFLYIIWKNYPSSLLRKHWKKIARAQLAISSDALRSWRGAGARARLRGQLAGLWGFFRMRHKRAEIQAARRIDDRTLEALFTTVDDTQSQR